MLQLGHILEIVHALAAGQQFVEGLRAAQQQEAEQDDLGVHQLQLFFRALFPAVGAAAHHQARQAATFEAAQGVADLARAEVEHRFAAGLLVAGQDHGVQGQWVGFRGGGLLLDQATQYTCLDAGQRLASQRVLAGQGLGQVAHGGTLKGKGQALA